MRIKTIKFVPDEDWLVAEISLEPEGSLTLRIRRNAGHIWSIRKARGEATLTFRVQPEGRTYYQDELECLARDLGRWDFLGIGNTGQLLFDQSIEAQPVANLEPHDLLDNADDSIHYVSDVPIPGCSPSDPPP